MPVNVTYPGVYIDEVKSAVRTITGVATSVAAFVGYAPRGPADRPVHITGWADYEAHFGGLQPNCPMSYAVYQFYLNGGSEAEIVRVVKREAKPVRLPLGTGSGSPGKASGQPTPSASPASAADSEGGEATASGEDSADDKKKTRGGGDTGAAKGTAAGRSSGTTAAAPPVLVAASPGLWGQNLRARVDHDTQPVPDGEQRKLFNLTVRDMSTGAEERYLNVTVEQGSPRSLGNLLKSSRLVRVQDGEGAPTVPEESLPPDAQHEGLDPFDAMNGNTPCYYPALKNPTGSDGDERPTDPNDYHGEPAAKSGLHQLLKTDIFNILCLPDAERLGPAGVPVRQAAQRLCVERRAVLLVDPPPSWNTDPASVIGNLKDVQGDESDKNAAVYYPRVLAPDPLLQGAVRPFPPCGVMAGVLARTDVQRGVWKAPAGTDASLTGVSDLEAPLTDLEIGRLNPLGVNCLRRLPAAGPVAWGARTLRGADRLADEWKYLPVRRLALFIEESLFRGTQWVVFEPNDEPLWASVRLNVGAFMNSLFRAGAFQGRTPQEAYLVKCDKDTNPQNDIDRGIVNIHVGFAPLKPAEFVIVHIQQLAGQIQV
ncbi:phage tail sheath family protein [Streptomyces sp. NPDC054884]|uniref:phage tail sheath family protein n=1 Tax=Streptomyces sp. ME08-AFT2 TaxID=3028683 RepID=UPI0029A24B38|nr:phage tail sheath C-terminal domain-containing protein [Streptomyces sp. ME08-AFT2]MDX3310052.1 phage tail sheath subtilisin-like domain-containing protein [Streptomyces sp. ME08-AFT2]